MSIDFPAALRRFKPDKQLAQPGLRARAELISAADVAGDGRAAFVLDTNVYIRSAAGTLPGAAAALVDRDLLFHCSVCVAEPATGVANSNPARAGWKATRAYYSALIATVPVTRLLTPDPQIWAEAGLIAGTLARIQNFQRHQRMDA